VVVIGKGFNFGEFKRGELHEKHIVNVGVLGSKLSNTFPQRYGWWTQTIAGCLTNVSMDVKMEPDCCCEINCVHGYEQAKNIFLGYGTLYKRYPGHPCGVNVRNIGQGETRHRKYKRLKLDGGQACDR
jgi:hypothetical protein